MSDIRVEAAGARVYRVTVSARGSTSSHEVELPDGYRRELGVEDVEPETLIGESFRFLLEREPKESILPSFDLPVIARYFPEYPEEIARRLT